MLALVLRVASVPVGVGVGLWTAQLTTYQNPCSPGPICLDRLSALPTFATWQCILFGAGATAFLLLLSFAVARLPSATRSNLSDGGSLATGSTTPEHPSVTVLAHHGRDDRLRTEP
jgi:hypothetical protein